MMYILTSIGLCVVFLIFNKAVLSDTECSSLAKSEGLQVIHTCNNTNVTGQHIILDTFDVGMSGDDATCQCDVTIAFLTTTSLTNFTVDSYKDLFPRFPGCGSAISLTIEKQNSIRGETYTCFVDKDEYDVSYGEKITLDWSREQNSSDAKYCLQLTSPSVMTIRCYDSQQTTTVTSTAAMMITTTRGDDSNVGNVSSKMVETTTDVSTTSEDKVIIYASVAAAGGFLILLFSCLVVSVLCQKRDENTVRDEVPKARKVSDNWTMQPMNEINEIELQTSDDPEVESPTTGSINGTIRPYSNSTSTNASDNVSEDDVPGDIYAKVDKARNKNSMNGSENNVITVNGIEIPVSD